jgi:hypothetical protein
MTPKICSEREDKLWLISFYYKTDADTPILYFFTYKKPNYKILQKLYWKKVNIQRIVNIQRVFEMRIKEDCKLRRIVNDIIDSILL